MSVYGPLISPNRIEAAFIATIRGWLHEYLGAVERADGLPVYPATGCLPRPVAAAWHTTTGDALAAPQLRLPRIVVQSAGWVSPAESDGATLETSWGVAVIAFLKGRDATETRMFTNAYATALLALLVQKGTENSLISDVEVLDVNLDVAESARERTFQGCEVVCAVRVPASVQMWGGPVGTPAQLPAPPTNPPDWPAVQSTVVTVQNQPTNEELP